MTISELMEQLKEMSSDLPVHFLNDDGDIFDIDAILRSEDKVFLERGWKGYLKHESN